MNKTKLLNTKLLVRLSLLSAIGVLLFYVVAFRIPPFPEHLTYDAGDIPVESPPVPLDLYSECWYNS